MRVRETVEGPCEYTISLDLFGNTILLDLFGKKYKYHTISLESSRGGLVVERLLHKKCHSATVDRIPLEEI